MRNLLTWLYHEAHYAIESLGYRIRPYDMVLDRRRWFWQPRGCWRSTRKGRAMQAKLTRILNGDDRG